jgi:uncharacterized protein YwqG
MVAQINFGELPRLKDYPESGLLQFFIAEDGILDSTEQVHCVYHADTKARQSNNIIKTTYDSGWYSDGGYPFTGCILLRGSLQTQWLNESCADFEKFMDPLIKKEYGCTYSQLYNKNYSAWRAICDDLWKFDIIAGHRIGGYPFFTQGDARSSRWPELLLQIDSDRKNGIAWGDNGVSNFFIGKQSLINKKFGHPNVMFTWNCY